MREEMADNAPGSGLSQALVIHASAVNVNGSAWVFLGPSGAGKSTMCQLLAPHTECLADDWTCFVSIAGNGGWLVTGADLGTKNLPFSRQNSAQQNFVPLQAIFRLRQAEALSVQRMDEFEVCQELLISFLGLPPSTRFDMKSRKLIFSHIATISRFIPGYQLYFPRLADVFQFINKEVFGNITGSD